MKITHNIHHVPRINNHEIHAKDFKIMIGFKGTNNIIDLDEGEYGYTYHNKGNRIDMFEMISKVSEDEYSINVYELEMVGNSESECRIMYNLGEMLYQYEPLDKILDMCNWLSI